MSVNDAFPGRLRPDLESVARTRWLCKSALMWIVRFEMVSPEEHPEHYFFGRGTRPVVKPDQVPDQHWKLVVVTHWTHPIAVGQLRDLNYRITCGALIRAVRLHRVVDAQIRSRVEDHEDHDQQVAGDQVDQRQQSRQDGLADPGRQG